MVWCARVSEHLLYTYFNRNSQTLEILILIGGKKEKILTAVIIIY
jgi:hypothetical protein